MIETSVSRLREKAQLATAYLRPTMTLRELARKSDIWPSTLSRFLKGGNMTSEKLERLERALEAHDARDRDV